MLRCNRQYAGLWPGVKFTPSQVQSVSSQIHSGPSQVQLVLTQGYWGSFGFVLLRRCSWVFVALRFGSFEFVRVRGGLNLLEFQQRQ